MVELSEKQLKCSHYWTFPFEDLITGSRKQDCLNCGARRQLPSPKGSPAWKAQMMMKHEHLSSCTIGEAEVWFDENKNRIERLERFDGR